jgi:hypothetical protein
MFAFPDPDAMDEDLLIMDAMELFGGSFVKALANAARMADPINLAKIKATWPDYWDTYREMAAKN